MNRKSINKCWHNADFLIVILEHFTHSFVKTDCCIRVYLKYRSVNLIKFQTKRVFNTFTSLNKLAKTELGMDRAINEDTLTVAKCIYFAFCLYLCSVNVIVHAIVINILEAHLHVNYVLHN